MEHKPRPDFITKLAAAVDKINAYKDYFYDKGAKAFKWNGDRFEATFSTSKD